jgi:hypothetical protein
MSRAGPASSPTARGGGRPTRPTLPLNSGFVSWRKPLLDVAWAEKAWPTRAATDVASVLDPESDVCLLARYDEWRLPRKDQRVEHNEQQLAALLDQL